MSNDFCWEPVATIKGITGGLGHAARSHIAVANPLTLQCHMKVAYVTDTLNLALAAAGCDSVEVEHKPRLLSDNGGCYIAEDLSDWLRERQMGQLHGSPGQPQTQGKIERWHQTLKNRILLENYVFKQDLEAQISAFVEHYNH